jgi:hypothetical protein
MFFFISIVIYEIVKFYVTLPKKNSNWEPSSPVTVDSGVFCVLIYDFSEYISANRIRKRLADL